jgi:hypothetical protein
VFNHHLTAFDFHINLIKKQIIDAQQLSLSEENGQTAISGEVRFL